MFALHKENICEKRTVPRVKTHILCMLRIQLFIHWSLTTRVLAEVSMLVSLNNTNSIIIINNNTTVYSIANNCNNNLWEHILHRKANASLIKK